MTPFEKRTFLESEAGAWVRERIEKERKGSLSRFRDKGRMEEIFALNVLDRLATEMAVGNNAVDKEIA